jgi:hypothetical protein
MENQDKKAILQGMGKDIAVAIQSAMQATYKAVGAKAVVQEAVSLIPEAVESEWEERHKKGECNGDDLFVAKAVVSSFREKISSLLEETNVNIGVCNGQLTGLSRAMQTLEQKFLIAVKEEEKAEAEKEAVPQHPGPGIAAERKAEAAKESVVDNVARFSDRLNKAKSS